jgi:hypothetical protein
MLFAFLLAISGLTLSAVAIYYSVIGLTAVFAASFWAVAIMGTTLEVSKLVAASWLKAYWDKIPLSMKIYMSTAVIVLMFITSMGIFGFLSKAHLDQNISSGDVQSKIAIYDEKINTERENINAARTALSQMDAQVNERLSRSTDDRGAERAVQIRRQQQAERRRLQEDIVTAQTNINRLNEERAPIASEVRKVEAEVGPIKYIAKLMYGDDPDANLLEKAVTWVIMIIVFVFDPLAVLMLLGAQMTWRWHKEQKEIKSTEGDSPEKESTIVSTAGVTEPLEEEIDLDYVNQQLVEAAIVAEPVEPDVPKKTVTFVDHGEHPKDTFDYDTVEVEQTPETTANGLEQVETVEFDIVQHAQTYDVEDELDDSAKNAMRHWKEEHPDETIKEVRLKKELGIIQHLPWEIPITEDSESSKKKTTYIVKENNQQITKTKE